MGVEITLDELENQQNHLNISGNGNNEAQIVNIDSYTAVSHLPGNGVILQSNCRSIEQPEEVNEDNDHNSYLAGQKLIDGEIINL